jgi:hypothetical protein
VSRYQVGPKRVSPLVELDGVTKSLREWCGLLKIAEGVVRQRRYLGWSWEKALRAPIQRKKKQNGDA